MGVLCPCECEDAVFGELRRSWVAGVTFDAQMCVLGDHSSANMLNNIYRIVSVGQDGMVAVWDLLMDEVSAVPYHYGTINGPSAPRMVDTTRVHSEHCSLSEH